MIILVISEGVIINEVNNYHFNVNMPVFNYEDSSSANNKGSFKKFNSSNASSSIIASDKIEKKDQKQKVYNMKQFFNKNVNNSGNVTEASSRVSYNN